MIRFLWKEYGILFIAVIGTLVFVVSILTTSYFVQQQRKTAQIPCFVFDSASKTITDFIADKEGCPSTIYIPSEIDGVDVKIIGDSAFRGKGLHSVTIEEGVEEIGKEAFADNGLTEIYIPETVTRIGEDALDGNQF